MSDILLAVKSDFDAGLARAAGHVVHGLDGGLGGSCVGELHNAVGKINNNKFA